MTILKKAVLIEIEVPEKYDGDFFENEEGLREDVEIILQHHVMRNLKQPVDGRDMNNTRYSVCVSEIKGDGLNECWVEKLHYLDEKGKVYGK